MTSFISKYQHIGHPQISDINLQDLTLNNSPEHIRSILASIIETTSLKVNPIFDHQPHAFVFSNIYDSLGMDLDIFAQVKFKHAIKQILVCVSLLKNGVPFRIYHRDQIVLLSNFFLLANRGNKYGSFHINPLNGEFGLLLNSVMTPQQYELMIYDSNKCGYFIENDLLKGKIFFKKYICKILHITNELPLNYHEDPALNNFKVKLISPQAQYHLELINKMVPFLNTVFPWMFEYQESEELREGRDSKKMTTDLASALCLASTKLNANIVDVIGMLSPHKCNIQLNPMFKFEEIREFKKYLSQPLVKYRDGQPPQIFSEIKIEAVRSWDYLDQGGFGLIYQGLVKASYPGTHTPTINTRYLVKKESCTLNQGKMKHEKDIIGLMKNDVCAYIAKFFYSKQEGYQKFLFIEYCAHKSLANYRMKFKQIMNLESKLLVLKYIAQGIKFLKDRSICHLDLKPANILFGANHVKITDFGQSFSKEICSQNFRPGTSYPYAPPQCFSNFGINFNIKMDVFSFGMLIYEIVFDGFPFDYSWFRNEMRKVHTESDIFFITTTVPEKWKRTGYQIIYDHLSLLAAKCIEVQSNKRPNIEWIIIIIQQCLLILQKGILSAI